MNEVKLGIVTARFLGDVRRLLKRWGWKCSFPKITQTGSTTIYTIVVAGGKQRIRLCYHMDNAEFNLVVRSGTVKWELDSDELDPLKQLESLLESIEDIPFMLFN